MSEPVIRTEGLVKEFPVASKTLGEPRKVLHAVTNVSLSVPKGGIFGIVGESGCGKSTLGRCLLRLETITKGSVFFQGRDITNLSGKDLLPLRKNMQMIFQNPYGSFDPKQKIGAALTEVAAVHKMDAAQAQEKIHNLLEQINLPQDALNHIPSEMSGGQLQRLAIARALLLDPAFIVADECNASDGYKDAIVNALESDTRVYRNPGTGRNVRTVTSPLVEKFFEVLKEEGYDKAKLLMGGGIAHAMKDGDPEQSTFMAGQSAGSVVRRGTCREIIERMMQEAREAALEQVEKWR